MCLRVAFLVSVLLLAGSPAYCAGPSSSIDIAAVPSTPGTSQRIYGYTGNGGLGTPVAGGHDCDGDGFADYAFASMLASPAQRNRAGEVYLVFGDGLIHGSLDSAQPTSRILRILGAGPLEMTGSELWMDDVTGDGIGDLLIARQNFRADATRPGAGALTIVVGGSELRAHAATLQPLDLVAPPATVKLFTVVGERALDRLGIWVRSGDVSGDGVADIAVGADQHDLAGGTDNGAVYVIRGGPHLGAQGSLDLADLGSSSLEGHVAKLLPPAVGSDEYHYGATCQIGDLDGNGRGEVLAAATINRAGGSIRADGAATGSAHAVGGSSRGTLFIAWDDNFPQGTWPNGFTIALDAAPGTTTVIEGGAGNRSFGEEILAGLDYDADGAADLFVGDIVGDRTPDSSRPNGGSGHLFFNAASLKGLAFDVDTVPIGSPVSVFLGGTFNDISADTGLHGDFDGDGIDDLAFSTPHRAPFGRGSAGAIHVFFGQAAPWPPSIDLAHGALPEASQLRIAEVYGARGNAPGDAGDTLCYSAAAGDLDGDGTTDIITNEMTGNGVTPQAVDVGNLLLMSGAYVSDGDVVRGCPPVPASGCRGPRRASLRVRNNVSTKGRLKWKWKADEGTSVADFLDPVAEAQPAYRLCVYSGDASGLVFESVVRGRAQCRGRACWYRNRAHGYGLRDRVATGTGVEQVDLRARAGRQVLALYRARSGDLELPLALPLRVQFSAQDPGALRCWESLHTEAQRNDTGGFQAP